MAPLPIAIPFNFIYFTVSGLALPSTIALAKKGTYIPIYRKIKNLIYIPP